LSSEVQPAQTNVSTANADVDSSSPVQTQLSAVSAGFAYRQYKLTL